MTPDLEARELNIRIDAQDLLRGVGLRVPAGSTLAVLGPSGGGKSTLLKALAGLIPLNRGTVALGGEDITHVPPRKRGVVYLFQEALLFPHLDAWGNLAFPLKVAGATDEEIEREVGAMLTALDMVDHSKKGAEQLSGGQKQRISFGRALLSHPRCLLLDEPFGALDADTRRQMQRLFKSIIAERGLTTIFVTHDLREALVIGDRFARMENGVLTAYADRQAFVQDPQNGAADEISFWATLTP